MDKEFILSHSSGIAISPQLGIEELINIPGVRERDMYNGWVWYNLPETEIGGSRVIVSIAYFEQLIKRVDIGLSDPEIYGESWDDWSEEKEKKRAEDTAVWLTSVGFPPGIYSWGEVWTGYDSNGGVGYGSIRFG